MHHCRQSIAGNQNHVSSINPALYESSQSPLLPQKNHYDSSISPTARTLAIEQGRKELMEMIRDKPESFFELSLKDMVDQQQHMHIMEDEIVEKPGCWPFFQFKKSKWKGYGG